MNSHTATTQHTRQTNTPKSADPVVGLAVRRAVAPPDPALVWRLQSEHSAAAISLLLNTTAGSVMSEADRKRLRALAAQAQARLRPNADSVDVANLLTTLDRMADAAVAEETGAALAIYVSDSMAERLRLPVEVVERLVIESSFATRDLVRAMHRTPRHTVLVLSEEQAHLYSGVAGDLQRAVSRTFPMARKAGVELTAFLESVDTALGAYLRVHPTPVVVVAPPSALSVITGMSRNLTRMAGTLDGDLATASRAELAARIGPILETYLRSRQDEALQVLDRRVGEHQAVSGIAEAWLAARRDRPEMLAVEEGLFVPARLSADGDEVILADDIDDPSVIPDLIDELIETVLHRGGWVALVEDGTLASHEGVALTVRRD